MKIAFSKHAGLRFVFFYHSVVSDWNHGNAHFLRGIARELIHRGHDVRIYEPEGGWSLQNLIREHGRGPVTRFHQLFPELNPLFYHPDRLDLDLALEGADVVLVHEWNSPELISRLGNYRRHCNNFLLFFHDTHHRAVSDERAMSRNDLSNYDGVLAFGNALRDLYMEKGWSERAWTWHEAADVRTFFPIPSRRYTGDLIWIGNWGDNERTEELQQFLIQPATDLNLKTHMYGVRYPHNVAETLKANGISYRGWLPNYDVPRTWNSFRFTIHIPRRPYVRDLPGIPTIRAFEAMATGIPLICAQWQDTEQLFNPGKDFLGADTPEQVKTHMRLLLKDKDAAEEISNEALKTIHKRHTCAHRVEELMQICQTLRTPIKRRAIGA
jgi:spore maturation protein CgeB